MAQATQQCLHCGYFYTGESGFYSEDYARYWLMSPLRGANWCFHCSKITTLKQARALGIFPTSYVKPHRVMDLPAYLTSDLGTHREPQGAMAATHLVRMIWHCLALHHPDDEAGDEATFRMALEKLGPPISAQMFYTITHYDHFAGLERRIFEGVYMARRLDQWTIAKWLDKYNSVPGAAEAKFYFEQSLSL